jgi:acetate kinase
MHKHDCILTINAGSSSIRFAIYTTGSELQQNLSGKIERIGLKDAIFTINQNNNKSEKKIDASSFHKATIFLIGWFEKQDWFNNIKSIGHRVVHGMNHTQPEIITKELLEELHKIIAYDPDHLPAEIELIKAFRKRYPDLVQVACFDTAFHTSMPRVAKLLPIPRRFDDKGVHRYGFHGLSYSYLMEQLTKIVGKEKANGRVILAHLGNGASLAAVRNGKSIDTTMGFTPSGGLPMSTRCGDIDPGVAWYILKSENLTPSQFNQLINHESGMLGISEISSNMQDLLEHEAKDIRAAEAVALFCYQVKKWIGAYIAALGGLDTLVFSGGIGENSPTIRSRICEGLEFIGVKLYEKRNKNNSPVISMDNSPVTVRMIHTNEESMIAKSVSKILKSI